MATLLTLLAVFILAQTCHGKCAPSNSIVHTDKERRQIRHGPMPAVVQDFYDWIRFSPQVDFVQDVSSSQITYQKWTIMDFAMGLQRAGKNFSLDRPIYQRPVEVCDMVYDGDYVEFRIRKSGETIRNYFNGLQFKADRLKNARPNARTLEPYVRYAIGFGNGYEMLSSLKRMRGPTILGLSASSVTDLNFEDELHRVFPNFEHRYVFKPGGTRHWAGTPFECRVYIISWVRVF